MEYDLRVEMIWVTIEGFVMLTMDIENKITFLITISVASQSG